jgi:aminobenzoyl-glutamate utilization protein B
MERARNKSGNMLPHSRAAFGREEVTMKNVFTLVLILALPATLHSQAKESPSKAGTGDHALPLRKMDSQAEHFSELSRRIWEFAEVGYKETRSSELLKSELRASGFQVQENIANIPTAFVASWGQGKPVIALLAEYDALPGLSQGDTPEKKPRAGGVAGHGCGHNLLGAASVFAAITLKDLLVEKRMSGTIRLYGTPAEEGGSGKVYMARAGVLQDCDVALDWHPGSHNYTGWNTLATFSAKFRFFGTAAHAANSPDKGRSALDAVMLMNHAVELLREHVPDSTRMHYIITKGGAAPNIVPDLAKVYHYARHREMPVLDGIWARIMKCGEAAALATETRDGDGDHPQQLQLPSQRRAEHLAGPQSAPSGRCALLCRGANIRGEAPHHASRR